MIIYWFMFFSCTLIAYFSQRRRVKIPNALGETVYKPNVALAIMSAIPLVFFVGVRGYMADTTAYIKSFEDMNTEFIKDVLKNPGEFSALHVYGFAFISTRIPLPSASFCISELPLLHGFLTECANILR